MELGRQAGFVKDIPGVFYESGIIEYLGGILHQFKGNVLKFITRENHVKPLSYACDLKISSQFKYLQFRCDIFR